jgi:ABC-type amino acid transport substrate-binding protein
MAAGPGPAYPPGSLSPENVVKLAIAAVAAILALVPAFAAAHSAEGRIEQIRRTKTVAIAHRTDALPFSFVDESKNPAGYSIDLCKRVVAALEQQLGVSGLQIKWVPVTTQERFEAIAGRKADMECGSSTVTLARMKQVDFSNYIFVDGTGLLARADLKARTLADLGGRKIAVIAGTTNETALAGALKERVVNAQVVKVRDRGEGLAKLEASEVDALASDGILLMGLAPIAKNPKALALMDDALSLEPYAIALPRDDAAFRIEVNAALARIYRSAAIEEIYSRWFGKLGKPGPALRAAYGMGAIPE